MVWVERTALPSPFHLACVIVMGCLMKLKVSSLLTGILSLLLACWMAYPARAEDADSSSQRYSLGEAVNAGLDTGYAENNTIKDGDPHFGWRLGRFSVTGFTSVQRDSADHPTFLKTSGDQITLWFNLEQDINALNGDPILTIFDDENGYDERMQQQREKEGFGRGALFVRQTNYENDQGKPLPYTNYLVGIERGADTQVQLFEEGDYEVALDYEIKKDPRNLLGLSIFPEYHNYTIRFSFSVRNGNAMIFPFDISTGAELTNSSTTDKGFYIDLAKSRYLDVYVKREVLTDSGEWDTRSNEVARDGQQYTDEGVYTITAANPTTGQTTSKKIYVGNNGVLKAYVSTGYSIDQIKDQIAQGASVSDDGSIVWPATSQAAEDASAEAPADTGGSQQSTDAADAQVPVGLIAGGLMAFAIIVIFVIVRRKQAHILAAGAGTGAARDGVKSQSEGDDAL